MTNGEPYTDCNQPGRLDLNGEEWWACDPYPTWFRWEGSMLVTRGYEGSTGKWHRVVRAVRFVDEPYLPYTPSIRDPKDCYGHDNHTVSCDGIIKARWSGVRCDCGARWFCL